MFSVFGPLHQQPCDILSKQREFSGGSGNFYFTDVFKDFYLVIKNSGHLPIKTKGWYNPLEAKINFAVPSHIHLQQHPITLKLPEINGPGMFNEILDIISKDNNNSFVLIFDGKKLAPGLT